MALTPESSTTRCGLGVREFRLILRHCTTLLQSEIWGAAERRLVPVACKWRDPTTHRFRCPYSRQVFLRNSPIPNPGPFIVFFRWSRKI
jgi:hypothetical protein